MQCNPEGRIRPPRASDLTWARPATADPADNPSSFSYRPPGSQQAGNSQPNLKSGSESKPSSRHVTSGHAAQIQIPDLGPSPHDLGRMGPDAREHMLYAEYEVGEAADRRSPSRGSRPGASHAGAVSSQGGSLWETLGVNPSGGPSQSNSSGGDALHGGASIGEDSGLDEALDGASRELERLEGDLRRGGGSGVDDRDED